MMKNELLRKITDHYLTSEDFNGIMLGDMEPFDMDDLHALIREKQVFVLSEHSTINVFINAYNQFGSPEEQIEVLNQGGLICVYPTSGYLATLDIQESKPFTKMLALGAEQLRVLYFSVDILEIYAQNPQYEIWDHGYRGRICVKDETIDGDDPIHTEYIKDFGVAYPTAGEIDGDRAVAVFLRDLACLNEEAQYKWRGFLLPDQKAFVVNDGFVKNLVHGNWVTTVWIFDAVLEEIALINCYTKNMNLPPLFRKDYSRDSQELIGYRIILVPSLKNYYDFVSAVEKIVVNNLNMRAFQTDIGTIKAVERRKTDGTLKGSIEMLEEWIKQNHRFYNPEAEARFEIDVTGVFRKIRKIRQAPAHELYDNRHDKTLYRKQNELIEDVYHALLCLRLMFGSHPSNRQIEIPEMLKNYENIVLY